MSGFGLKFFPHDDGCVCHQQKSQSKPCPTYLHMELIITCNMLLSGDLYNRGLISWAMQLVSSEASSTLNDINQKLSKSQRVATLNGKRSWSFMIARQASKTPFSCRLSSHDARSNFTAAAAWNYWQGKLCLLCQLQWSLLLLFSAYFQADTPALDFCQFHKDDLHLNFPPKVTIKSIILSNDIEPEKWQTASEQ